MDFAPALFRPSRAPRPRPGLALAACLALALAAGTVSAQDSFTLTGKVRDFKEMKGVDTDGAHPHFNNQNGCNARELNVATVEAEIDDSQSEDGGAFPGDERGPVLAQDMNSSMARCFTPMDRFGEWFQDHEGVNRAFLIDLPFRRVAGTDLFRFSSSAFFPVDDGAPWRKLDPADPDPFGHLQTGLYDGKDVSLHNYGFTMEVHTSITWRQGTGQVLEFQGDDDIWVFLDGKLIADLGGVHSTVGTSPSLDSLGAALGLTDGATYPLDVFFAERHMASSTLTLTIPQPQSNVGIRPRPRLAGRGPAGGAFDVYDRAGRLVRRVRDAGARPAWDGLDEAGRPAAPGVYFWRSAEGPAGAPQARAGTLHRF